MSAPSTLTGKVLLVLYGLLGCSATILFFNLFLERVITMLSLFIHWCHRVRSQHSQLEDNKENENKWKPSIPQVTLIVLVSVLLVACCAASVYSAMEGWTFFESLYFCFVAFSTVGFGDFVSGQQKEHEETRGYQVANCLLMLLGVCCTYSLFNAISAIIRLGLNWLLSCLDALYLCVKHFRFTRIFGLGQKRFHQHGSCYSNKGGLGCSKERGKCFYNGAKVVTVSGRNQDIEFLN